MTKENFNKTVSLGDIVRVFGSDKVVDCIVKTKTDYAVNLVTLDNYASYYRTYDEIIQKIA